MDVTDELIIIFNNLFVCLTDLNLDQDEFGIFSRHNDKLDSCGDISFPLNYCAWKKYVEFDNKTAFFKYLKQKTAIANLEICNHIITTSKYWPISIIKCSIENERLLIFLNRAKAFENIITCILSQKNYYGSSKISYSSKIEIQLENNEIDLSKMDLTQLRMKLLKDVVINLLDLTGNKKFENSEMIYLSFKSKSKVEAKKIVCGTVVSNKFGKNNYKITAEEYFSKRTIDMRLMAQHKYGLRVKESGWADYFKKLGNAAVIIDLLHVKPSRQIVLNVENATSPHSKGASFILYNCARLAAIFKQFDEKVESGQYPPLPDIKKIDFSLLNQPEEWKILFAYLMPYPQIVKSCIKDISECKLNVHYLCTYLDSLCSTFSVYYRRIRILTESRTHLFPILHTRIYFLKAVEQVFHNALSILNITPVTQM